MMKQQMNKELLSALVDGELRGAELEQALAWAESEEGCASWSIYHMVGDVLRSPDLAHHRQHDLLSGLRVQLAQEPLPQLSASPALQPAVMQQISPAVHGGGGQSVIALKDPAANASVFRWKVAASFASLAAVVALGWNVWSEVNGPTQAQWASAPAAAPVIVATENGDVLRDPRLDALLASQQQYRAALQAPADFLRNASFAERSRQSSAP